MALLKKQKEQLVQKKDEEDKKKATSVKTKKSEKSKEKKVKRGLSKKALEILVRPLVTEKVAQVSDRNVLVFEVDRRANRVEIKQAFKEVYGVLPERVNVLNIRGKRVSFGRTLGKRKDWKKAFIMLPKDAKVDIFEAM